jgi:hypothetical protein
VNRIPASGDVELPDGTTEYRSGWGCALCFEECGYEDATGYVCHDCADADDLDSGHVIPQSPHDRGLEPVFADDIESRAECHLCGRVLHDWNGWEDGIPTR